MSDVERARKVRNFVRKLVNTHKPALVAIEQPVIGRESSEMLHGLYFLIVDALLSKKCPIVAFHNMSLKKLATGSGKAKKSEMKKAAKDTLGIDMRIVHDEADAFFLAYFAHRFWQSWKLEESRELLSSVEQELFFSGEKNKSGLKKGIIYRRGESLYLP